MGKLRRAYLTVEYGTVVKCGHSFNPHQQPHTNCPDCWEAYFKSGVNIEELRTQLAEGVEAITKARGSKFVKKLRQFFETELWNFKQAVEDPGFDASDLERNNGIPEETSGAAEITGSPVTASTEDQSGAGQASS